MATLSTRIRNAISGLLASATVKQVVAGVVAAIGVAAGLAWAWVWHHVNPQFDYHAPPSALSSHFVGLTQALSQIERDSRLYCTGGWDERMARIGLRRCYRIRFEPRELYRMTVCTHDERSLDIVTSDQLLALQYFARAVAPNQCLAAHAEGGPDEVVVRQGSSVGFVNLQYAGEAPQPTAFCGCSSDEIAQIAGTSGATIK